MGDPCLELNVTNCNYTCSNELAQCVGEGEGCPVPEAIEEEEMDGATIGIIAGTTVGGTLLLCLAVVILVVFLVRRNRRGKSSTPDSSGSDIPMTQLNSTSPVMSPVMSPPGKDYNSFHANSSNGSIVSVGSMGSYGPPPPPRPTNYVSPRVNSSAPIPPPRPGGAPRVASSASPLPRPGGAPVPPPRGSSAVPLSRYGATSPPPQTVQSGGSGGYVAYNRRGPVSPRSGSAGILSRGGKSWEIPHNEIQYHNQIGSGAFGDGKKGFVLTLVYFGTWRGGPVAVKLLRGDLDASQLAEFQSEAAVMASLRPHVESL